jgi:hypothetical protein
VNLRPASTVAAIAVCALLALAPSGGFAASVVPLDLNEIEASAVQIVHVRNIANTFQSDPAIGAVTVSTFVVLDHAKGQPGPTLTVRQAGGVLNGIAVDYHVPKFRIGEEYVLFLPAPSRLGLASPVGLAQGAFGVTQGPAGKEVGNGRDFAELLVGVDPAVIPPGAFARLQQAPALRGRMDLGDFMALLRAKGGQR